MPKLAQPKTYADYKTAKPKAKAYKMGDGNGLYLCVLPSGKKRWQWDYCFNNKRSTHRIGYFETMDLKDARKEACVLQSQLFKGIPPKSKNRQMKEAALTFESVAHEWGERQQWVDGHRKRVFGFFKNHVFPNIGEMRIDAITSKDIKGMLDKLEQQGHYGIAKELAQRCGSVFKYARRNYDRNIDNPAHEMADDIPTPEEKQRPSLKVEEIPEFLDRLDDYNGREYIKLGLYIMMLTFVRPSELRCATWGEFDLDKAEWHIPKERMKMRRDHIVPLSNQVIEALNRLKEVTRGSDYLFPSVHSAYKPISDVTFLKALKIMGYVDDKKIVPHGFRHTASTILHDNDFNSLHIERQLAHKDKNKIRGTYNAADYLIQRRNMMQWYSDFICGMRNG